MGTGDGPVVSNSGRIGEIAPSRSRGAFQQDNMSAVGEIEAKTGVLGEDKAGETPERITAAQNNQIDWETKTAEFKTKIADYQKDRRIQMEIFWNKYVKAAKKGLDVDEPNPDVLNNDIERWRANSKKKNSPLLQNLDNYRTHEALHSSVINHRTKAEKKKERENLATLGSTVIYDDDQYSVHQIETPEALSYFANKGTHWCTKRLETAQSLLREYDYNIIEKDGLPIAALKTDRDEHNEQYADQILYHTDFELRDGQTYAVASGQAKQPMPKEDFEFINDYLNKRGGEPLQKTFVNLYENKAEGINLLKNAIKENKTNQASFLLASFGRSGEIPDEVREDFLTLPNETIIQYVSSSKQRVREKEEEFSSDTSTAFDYSKALKQRFPGKFREKAEANIAKNHYRLSEYMSLIHERAPQLEEAIFDSLTETGLKYIEAAGLKRAPEPHRKSFERKMLMLWKQMNDDNKAEIKKYFAGVKDVITPEEKRDLMFAIDESSFALYAEIFGERVDPSLEAKLVLPGKLPRDILNYAQALGTRFPEPHRERAEHILSSSPRGAFSYAQLIDEPFPAGEDAIAKASKYSTKYADLLKKWTGNGRFEKGEAEITSSPGDVVRYAGIIKKDFPQGLDTLLRYPSWIADYVFVINQRSPAFEQKNRTVIKKSPAIGTANMRNYLRALNSVDSNATVEIMKNETDPVILWEVFSDFAENHKEGKQIPSNIAKELDNNPELFKNLLAAQEKYLFHPQVMRLAAKSDFSAKRFKDILYKKYEGNEVFKRLPMKLKTIEGIMQTPNRFLSFLKEVGDYTPEIILAFKPSRKQ